ncbi:hypothetical protein RhiXN_09171 [Rhizoctonia solani]|uniref:DUF7918 domain-containing protein n=1 Tax=Rhizoctonia solani TaxID=456999 RepID=A0A8H8NXK1_9AGAM|nr:uncharacterized protein RhiXN_09171 [Rhizoctonia solani]QRW20196.1 hypothetical protein RhiXN_09171 [Rhizoctonia solani]
MIYEDLSVSITNTQGKPLEEFKQLSTEENSVDIKLDGKKVSSGGLRPSKISRGIPGIKVGMTVAKGLKRYYVFGRHTITDREDLAQPDDPGRELMGTIQVTLSWSKYGRPQRRYEPYRNPEEPRFVHERAVKKGHLGSATLGAPIRKSHCSGRVCEREDAGFPKVVFLFRYGPRDWLEAKDIIIVERYPTTRDSKPKSTRRTIKKERELTTSASIAETLKSHSSMTCQGQSQGRSDEIIDVDALDSDNDSDVVVLNDPVEPKVFGKGVKTET